MRSQLDSSKQLARCRIWGRTYQQDGPSPSSTLRTTPPPTTYRAARRLRWRSIRNMRTTLLSSAASSCGCGAGRTTYLLKATVEGEVEAIRSRAQHAANRPAVRDLGGQNVSSPKRPRKLKSLVSAIADAQPYKAANPPMNQPIA